MLILTRQEGQRIFIGRDVIVTVTEIRQNSVRIGITAPETTEIHREEVFLDLNSPDPISQHDSISRHKKESKP